VARTARKLRQGSGVTAEIQGPVPCHRLCPPAPSPMPSGFSALATDRGGRHERVVPAADPGGPHSRLLAAGMGHTTLIPRGLAQLSGRQKRFHHWKRYHLWRYIQPRHKMWSLRIAADFSDCSLVPIEQIRIGRNAKALASVNMFLPAIECPPTAAQTIISRVRIRQNALFYQLVDPGLANSQVSGNISL
jgi:hypothetical protein